MAKFHRTLLFLFLNVYLSESVPILRSATKNWHAETKNRRFSPVHAYDGDMQTIYSPKDEDVEVNFLKMYLLKKHRIGTVMLTNREHCCQDRIIGTVVMVYSTEGGSETKVADCGTEIAGLIE